MSDAATRSPEGPRLILYVGKGGVGKTTAAAATAAVAAAHGRRTLVVSTDIAHSLGDVLDVSLGADPVPVADRLFALEINVLEETRREWGRIQQKLAALFEREGLSDVQADELAIVPGMEEVAALIRIGRTARTGEYDCIVVDAAPTGETIRLLSMPESFVWYAGRLQAWKSRIGRLAAPFLRGVLPEIDMLDVAASLVDRVKRLRALLIDPARSSYRIVVTPDRTVLKEARRAETYLNLFEYPIDAVVLNRVMPASEPRNPFLDALLERQDATIAEIRAAFPTLPILTAPYAAREPVGLAELRELGERLFTDRDPAAVLHVGPTLRIEATGDGYLLRVPMPNVEPGKLSLRRAGDEIYVEVGNVRREISLPTALLDLEPATARLRDGRLEVPFVRPASMGAARAKGESTG